MLTTVYLIRHSEKMRLQPHSLDRILPLSAVGERRAEKLLDIEEMRHADIAYASPFSRTIATLHYFLDADNMPLKLDERLKELEFGKIEHGKPELPGMDMRQRQWIDRDIAAPEGESLNECAARMTECMREIVAENAGKKILTASHGAAICAYLSQYMPEIDDDYTGHLPQPAVFRMVFDGKSVKNVERIL